MLDYKQAIVFLEQLFSSLPITNPSFDELLACDPDAGQITKQILLQVYFILNKGRVLFNKQNQNRYIDDLASLYNSTLQHQRKNIALLFNQSFTALFQGLIRKYYAHNDYLFLTVFKKIGKALNCQHFVVHPSEYLWLFFERIKGLPHSDFPALANHLIQVINEVMSPFVYSNSRRSSFALVHYSNYMDYIKVLTLNTCALPIKTQTQITSFCLLKDNLFSFQSLCFLNNLDLNNQCIYSKKIQLFSNQSKLRFFETFIVNTEEDKENLNGPYLLKQLSNSLYLYAVIKQQMKTTQSEYNLQNSQPSSPEAVNIYLRNAKKEARLILIHSPSYTKELKVIASIAFNVPQERIILFYNGFRIDNYNLPVTLTQRSIVHVMDRRNLQFQQIIVNFKPLWNAPSQRLACSPQSLVRQIVDQFLVPRLKMPQNKFFLVYAGKILNRSNKLNEQYIQQGAEISMVLRKEKQILEKVAFEHSSEKKSQFNQKRSSTNRPMTHLTTLDALKTNNQKQNGLQFNNMPINRSSKHDLSKIDGNQTKISGALAQKHQSNQGEAQQDKLENQVQSEQHKQGQKDQSQQKHKFIDHKILLLDSFYGFDQMKRENHKPLSHITTEKSAEPE